MANFGFILGGSPHQGEKMETLYHLAAAALGKEHNVFIFLHNEGVFAPMKNQVPLEEVENPRDLIEDLVNKGATIISSSIDIRARGIDSNKSYLDGIKTGGLPDLSEAISRMDRLIAL